MKLIGKGEHGIYLGNYLVKWVMNYTLCDQLLLRRDHYGSLRSCEGCIPSSMIRDP